MKPSKFSLFVLFTILFLGPALAFATIETFHISVLKVNKTYYANGKAIYKARCNVTNNTKRAGAFYVRIIGLDKNGDEQHSIQLDGTITKKGKKVLRNTNQMDAKTYKSITTWAVDEAEFY